MFEKKFKIPDFLQKDYVPSRKPDIEEVCVMELIEQHEKRFGEYVEYNVSMPFTDKELIDLLTTCLEKNITFKELTGYGGYDADDNDDY